MNVTSIPPLYCVRLNVADAHCVRRRRVRGVLWWEQTVSSLGMLARDSLGGLLG